MSFGSVGLAVDAIHNLPRWLVYHDLPSCLEEERKREELGKEGVRNKRYTQ